MLKATQGQSSYLGIKVFILSEMETRTCELVSKFSMVELEKIMIIWSNRNLDEKKIVF